MQSSDYAAVAAERKSISEDLKEVDSDVLLSQLKTMHLNGKNLPFTTEMIIDNQIGDIRLVKKFNDLNEYKKAKELFTTITQDFINNKEQLTQFSILPCEYDDKQRVVFFKHGCCTLKQLIDEPNFNITPDQSVQVFLALLESITVMKEHGYNHTNINPNNIYFVQDQEYSQNQYKLKLIDFEDISNLEIAKYTPAFFNSPMRQFNPNNNDTVKFKSSEEKIKNQFYSVIRIFQYILFGIRNQNTFLFDFKADKQDQLAILQNTQQKVNQQYADANQQHSINKILEFITQQGLEEKYGFDELKTLLLNLKQDMSIKQVYFYDSKNIIYQIQQKHDSKIKQIKQDPLALFIRMKAFIKQKGSYRLIKEKQFNIIDEIQQLLLSQNQSSNKNIAIIGESGSGKTLLLLKLNQELQQTQLQYNIVHIDLGDLKGQDKQQAKTQLKNLVQQQLEKLHSNKQFLLVLLDNYDQLNFKNLKIAKILTKKYKAVKIVVAVNDHKINQIELNSAFSQHDKIFISPFEQDQKVDFIKKLLDILKLQDYFQAPYKQLEERDNYLQILSENHSLDRLSQIPQLLTLITLSMPF